MCIVYIYVVYIHICLCILYIRYMCVYISIHIYIKKYVCYCFFSTPVRRITTTELSLLDERGEKKIKLKELKIARQNGKSFQKTTQV